jgi:hypothetical protein
MTEKMVILKESLISHPGLFCRNASSNIYSKCEIDPGTNPEMSGFAKKIDDPFSVLPFLIVRLSQGGIYPPFGMLQVQLECVQESQRARQ